MSIVLNYIFTIDFLVAILRMSTPLIFGSMAAVIVRKSGVVCIAFESMMISAAFGGVVGSALSQSLFVGMLSGMLSGMLIGALFAYFVLVLKADNMLVGLALNTLGSGGTIFFLYAISGDKATSTSLLSLQFPKLVIPFIKDIPIIGNILSGHNILTFVAFLLVPAVYIFLYKTKLGLRIRVVGENPQAAESLGTNVFKMRFIALVVGGAIASFGGMFMSMGYLRYFTRDMVAGRGFMSLAATNLGGCSPIPTMLWAMVFGITSAIANALQAINLPPEFLQLMPYLSTVIGLMIVGITENKKEITTRKKMIENAKKAGSEVCTKSSNINI